MAFSGKSTRRAALIAFLLSISTTSHGALISGSIENLPESSSFSWGNGLSTLYQEWSAAGTTSGWFYASNYGSSNVDVAVVKGASGYSSSTAVNLNYQETGAVQAEEGDVVYFKGDNNNYGAWTIEDINWNPENEFPYSFLTGTWFFETIEEEQNDNSNITIVRDFSSENALDDWDAGGNGYVAVTTSSAEERSVMQMIVEDEDALESPVTAASMIEIPANPFILTFDFLFNEPTGSLNVSLDEMLLGTVFAKDYYDEENNSFATFSSLISNPVTLAKSFAELELALFPGSPASIDIGNIQIQRVSEPATLFLLFSSLLSTLVMRRRSKA